MKGWREGGGHWSRDFLVDQVTCTGWVRGKQGGVERWRGEYMDGQNDGSDKRG